MTKYNLVLCLAEAQWTLFLFLRRMQESYLEKNRKLLICFVDLEKAFARVPKMVIEWALMNTYTNIKFFPVSTSNLNPRFCFFVHRHYCLHQPFRNQLLSQRPLNHLLWHPIKSLFQIIIIIVLRSFPC